MCQSSQSEFFTCPQCARTPNDVHSANVGHMNFGRVPIVQIFGMLGFTRWPGAPSVKQSTSPGWHTSRGYKYESNFFRRHPVFQTNHTKTNVSNTSSLYKARMHFSTIFLALAFAVASVAGDCWWTSDCQLNSWANQGCTQYGRTTNGTQACTDSSGNAGNKYYCCTPPAGVSTGPRKSQHLI